MSNAIFHVPLAKNEPIKAYAPGSSDRDSLIQKYRELYNQDSIDVPMYIGGKEIRTSNKKPLTAPHDHAKILGYYNAGEASHVKDAIEAAMNARDELANLPWEDRPAVFLIF